MLKLRQQHLDAFESQVIKLFAARVLDHVKAVWPAECEELGEDAAATIVQTAIQRGSLLGLVSEHDFVRFVDLYFLLAADFDTNPFVVWVRPILADRSLTPAARLDRLYQRMETEFALIEKRSAKP